MNTMSKKSGQLNVSITREQEAFIASLAKFRITGPELVRGLIDTAAEFHAKHGWFSFPATITPQMFQIPTFMDETNPQNQTTNHARKRSAKNDSVLNTPMSEGGDSGADEALAKLNAKDVRQIPSTPSKAEREANNKRNGVQAQKPANRGRGSRSRGKPPGGE